MPIRRPKLRHHRGVLAALGLVLMGSISSALIWPVGPRSRWFGPERAWTGGVWPGSELSPDGRFLLLREERGGSILDVATGRLVALDGGGLDPEEPGPEPIEPAAKPTGGNPDDGTAPDETLLSEYPATFMYGGRHLFAAVGEMTRPSLRVWDVISGRAVATFRDYGDGTGMNASTCSADGSTLALIQRRLGEVETVTVWRSDGTTRKFPGSSPLALSGDGRRLAHAGSGRRSFLVRDFDSGRVVATVPMAEGRLIKYVALSPDGRLLAESRPEDGVGLWDVATSTRRAELSREDVVKPSFSPDGSLLTLRGVKDPYSAEIWDLTRPAPVRRYKGDVEAVTPDGHRMVRYTCNEEIPIPFSPMATDRAAVVDLPTMAIRGEIPGLEDQSVFSADGRWLAKRGGVTEPEISSRRHWMPLTWEVLLFPPNGFIVVVVHDAEDGRTIASIDMRSLGTLPPSFAFSADGQSLVTRTRVLSPSGTRGMFVDRVEVWDVPARRPVWVYWAAIAPVAIGLGRWSDVRSRRARSVGVPL